MSAITEVGQSARVMGTRCVFPAKQRHTAKRIFDRLRDEHQFSGGYTIVKDYVRGEQLRTREMFVPLTHAPVEAQADFPPQQRRRDWCRHRDSAAHVRGSRKASWSRRPSGGGRVPSARRPTRHGVEGALSLRSRAPSTPQIQQLPSDRLDYFYSAPVAWFHFGLDRSQFTNKCSWINTMLH